MRNICFFYLFLPAVILLLAPGAKSQALQWVESSGTPGVEQAWDIAVDNNGNSYLAGYFSGDTLKFSNDTGNHYLLPCTTMNGFFGKRDANGSYLWAHGFCGGQISFIKINEQKNILYLCGTSDTVTDFDFGIGTVHLDEQGVFIAKYDTAGNFKWLMGFQDSINFNVYGFSIDRYENLYLCGNVNGIDFDPGPGVSIVSGVAWSAGYVAKYDSSGTFIFVNALDGSAFDKTASVGADSLGYCYVIGELPNPIDFDPGPGSAILTPSDYSTYIAVYDSIGNYVWAKELYCTGFEMGKEIEVAPNGNFIISGQMSIDLDIDLGPGNVWLTSSCTTGGECYYLVKYDKNGNHLWGNTFFADLDFELWDITMDQSENVFICGSFRGVADFDPGTSYLPLTASEHQGYFARYNSNGNYVWAQAVTGGTGTRIHTIELGPSSDIYLTGYFTDTCDFDKDAPLVSPVIFGNCDIFSSRYSNSLTGIASTEMENYINIYPNPVSNELIVEIKDKRIATHLVRIYDVLGNIINTYTFDVPFIRIDVSQYNNGSYLLTVDESSQFYSTLFIKL
ncbi:MAG TPA: T9SS type A sorting domain-containing protein [Flavobacteriales bacterium]|nr:T9SS type A sorting domain-containing protein [Flavobacteriales bacterium]